jgi:L-amino acid N-acyltransferase YncA
LDSNNNYTIRLVREGDLDELLLMMQEHADYEKAAFSPDGKKERLKKALFNKFPKLNCWIVEAGGRLAGFVSYTFDYSTWDAAEFVNMDCLFLREYARGFGIGKDILNRLKEIASARQCINIQWHTPAFNLRGIHFYQRNNAESKEKVRFTLR